VDDRVHLVTGTRAAVWLPVRMPCRMTEGRRPILLLLLLVVVAGLRRCCCRFNVKLFSCVTLIRKLQTTSDLDHFHARQLPCSRAKSPDDPISGRRGYSGVLYCFIYTDTMEV